MCILHTFVFRSPLEGCPTSADRLSHEHLAGPLLYRRFFDAFLCWETQNIRVEKRLWQESTEGEVNDLGSMNPKYYERKTADVSPLKNSKKWELKQMSLVL